MVLVVEVGGGEWQNGGKGLAGSLGVEHRWGVPGWSVEGHIELRGGWVSGGILLSA